MKLTKYNTNILYTVKKETIPDPISQTWGTPPLGLYFQDQVFLSPEKHLALYSRDKKNKQTKIECVNELYSQFK